MGLRHPAPSTRSTCLLTSIGSDAITGTGPSLADEVITVDRRDEPLPPAPGPQGM